MHFAIQILVNMEQIAVIMEMATPASVTRAILGNTANVSSNGHIYNV